MDRSKDNLQETKVYKALNQLSIYELNRFKKFVESPYFNSNEKIIDLFSIYHKDFKIKTEFLSKRDNFESLYQDEAFSDAKFRRLNSQLLELFEKFLAQEVYEKHPLRQANYLLEYISKRRIVGLYNSTIKSAVKTSKKQRIKSSLNYYYDYLLETNLHKLRLEDLKRYEASNIEKISSNLDKFFIIEKLRFYTSKVLAQKAFIQKDYTFHFISDIEKNIDKVGYYEDPVIRLNFLVLKMLENPDNESLFENYKILLFEFVEELDAPEAFDYIVEAINYCIRQINQGNLKYEEELFGLYKFGLDTNLMIESNNFNHWDYRNICIIGLKQKEFKWVKEFNEEYKIELEKEYRENAYTYNQGLFYFYKKEFYKVISTLANVEYSDPTYTINSRALLLATYFELNEIDILISFSDNFTTYISRHKSFSEYIKNNYRELIKFTRRLVNYQPADLNKVIKLKDQIEKSKGVASKPWLLEKVDELIQKKSK